MHYQNSEQFRVKHHFLFFSIERFFFSFLIKIFDGHYDDDMVSFDDATSAPLALTSAINYASKLLEKFSSMRNKSELCDFRIDINDKQFFCHKFLLIATSDYFNAMFNGLNT
jgi:hypothetical protein